MSLPMMHAPFDQGSISPFPHISYTCKKIWKSAGIIFHSCFYLSTKTKLLLYYSLIYPYLTYYNLTWSSSYANNLNRIFLIQKRMVWAITNAPFHANTAPLFSQLTWYLQVYSFHIATICFFYSQTTIPSSFLRLITRSSDFHE